MIRPTNEELLEGVANSLEAQVLPELPQGGQARRQAQAAISIIRRIAFATPKMAATLTADNDDIEQTLRQVSALLNPAGAKQLDTALALIAAPDLIARNGALQALLAEFQAGSGTLPVDDAAQDAIAFQLRALYRRMLARELALIPPSKRRRAGGEPA